MKADVTTIWTEFQVELKRFILNRTRNQADTDDILQEVFLKIIHHIDKVNEAKNMRNYLYGIVRNTLYDHSKKRQPTVSEEFMPVELTDEETQSLNETIADCCVKPFIQQLPDKYKDALLLSDLQDVSQKELAERYQISYSAAKSRVQRGREKLKDLILECCAYESDAYGNLMDTEKENRPC